MNQRKQELRNIITDVRFSTVDEAAFSIYREFESLIEPEDIDDNCYLYFHRGESYYRTGRFQEAIIDFMRCIKKNTNPKYLWLTACSYNTLGLIYTLLGNEILAIENFERCLSLSKKHRLYHEITISYINIGSLYQDLDHYGMAMEFYQMAEASVHKNISSFYNLDILCLSYQGKIYCKQNNFELASIIQNKIENLISKETDFYYSPCLYSFYIRLYYHMGNMQAFWENLESLLHMAASQEDFLEFSEFYYDICDYLIEIGHQEEALQLLECMERSVNITNLIVAKYRVAQLKVKFYKQFGTGSEYISTCENFIELEEEFINYTKQMKITHLHNIEELEQIRLDTRRLRKKSQVDQLTGLFNKHTVEDMVKQQLESADPSHPIAVLLIDMDNFKQLNDSLGHLTGDKVLKDVSALITDCFSDNAICGRIGGDEFLVCFRNAFNQDIIQNQVSHFQDLLKDLSYGALLHYQIHASMGIAFSNKDLTNYNSLFVCADGALYTSKHQGKNRLSFGNQL